MRLRNFLSSSKSSYSLSLDGSIKPCFLSADVCDRRGNNIFNSLARKRLNPRMQIVKDSGDERRQNNDDRLAQQPLFRIVRLRISLVHDLQDFKIVIDVVADLEVTDKLALNGNHHPVQLFNQRDKLLGFAK